MALLKYRLLCQPFLTLIAPNNFEVQTAFKENTFKFFSFWKLLPDILVYYVKCRWYGIAKHAYIFTFQSKTLMYIYNFATVYSLMNHTNFD